jgi:Protein of unknown function (DUF2806)
MSNNSNDSSNASPPNIVQDAVRLISGASLADAAKKNFFKAFNQLCTAVVDIPVAYLEGIATERRAETQARVKLVETSADEIAAGMQFDPEYARAAVTKFGQRVIREQINLDQITRKAAESLLAEDSGGSGSAARTQEGINEDWLNGFEKEAAQKSTDQMQSLFSKILAGEILRPGTFSSKTVRLLGTMDQSVAMLFEKFCSMCIVLKIQADGASHVIDARVPSLGSNAAMNGLQDFGLTFSALNLLQEYGLVISDYNSWMDYSASFWSTVEPVKIPLYYGGRAWGLVRKEGFSGDQFRIVGVALTKSGQELMRVTSLRGDAKFFDALNKWLESSKLLMTPVAMT